MTNNATMAGKNQITIQTSINDVMDLYASINQAHRSSSEFELVTHQ